jgi:acetylornithine/succinyldiaminopimelate/putrescine aminotransferase
MSITNRQIFLQHLAQTSDSPLMLEIECAEGLYLFDVTGKKYLDLISGISVSSLGHCHPKVIGAIEDQSKKYLHLMVYGEYVETPQTQFAKLLIDNLPSELNSVYFTNSGTEATEGALKLAKRFTGRSEIVSFRNSYHGSTQGALSVLGDENFRNAFRPLIPGNRLLHFNHEEDLLLITEETAAVIAEPIQAEAGVIIPQHKFLQHLRKRCDDIGALLILDECQTGLGRTGTLWCFDQFEIIPDILLLAKSLGGGMPLGAFIANYELMKSFSNNPALGHITTFGGHPVSCAAGHAAMKVLLEESLIRGIEEKKNLFMELLHHSHIKSVRAAGLLMAIEFENETINKKIIAECIQRGVITDWFMFALHCMRIAPPLIISEDEIRNACSVILQSIGSIVS